MRRRRKKLTSVRMRRSRSRSCHRRRRGRRPNGPTGGHDQGRRRRCADGGAHLQRGRRGVRRHRPGHGLRLRCHRRRSRRRRRRTPTWRRSSRRGVLAHFCNIVVVGTDVFTLLTFGFTISHMKDILEGCFWALGMNIIRLHVTSCTVSL